MNRLFRRTTLRVSRTLLVLALLAAGGTAFAGLAALDATPAGAVTVPPWEPDPGSVGGLTFYNSSGAVITGGNLIDSPVAAYVEGTSTVRTGDSVATLYGYLPVNGQTTSEWSGEQLGSSTNFPNASAPSPLTSATQPVETGSSGDTTISGLASSFPNADTSGDGYASMYQLRLYTNAPRKSQTTTYDSADISINTTNGTWSVVYPESPTLLSLAATAPGTQPWGTAETLTATVTPANSGPATGSVDFKDGTTDLGTVSVNGSDQAAITLGSPLPVGTNAITATYTPTSGSGFSASNASTTITITAVSTTTTLGVAPTSGAGEPWGTPETLTATVTPTASGPATGGVDFKVGTTDLGSVTLSSGSAQLTGQLLPVGTDSLSAIYTPANGTGFATSTGTAALTVNTVSTTTTLGVSPTSGAGEPVGTTETLTATVTPTSAVPATGSVDFKVGTTDLGTVALSSGSAQLITSALPIGTDSLTATYTPTSGTGYSGSVGDATLDVTAISTSTALTVSPTSGAGEPWNTPETLTATVTPASSGPATGSIEFEVGTTDLGSVTLSSGSAQLTGQILPVGNDDLSAIYTPANGSDFATSTGDASLTVNGVSTSTALGVAPTGASEPWGTPETLTATVTPASSAPATGSIEFEVGTTDLGSVTLSGGSAQLANQILPVGTDSLSAIYTPANDTGYITSTGSASLDVTSVGTTTTLGVSPASPQFQGTSETLTATVTPTTSGPATGSVEFENGSTDLGSVTLSGGHAALSTTLPVGNDDLSAIYTPANGSGFTTSTGDATFTVNPLVATTTALATSPASPQPAGTSVTLTATVSPSSAGGSVDFKVASTDLGTVALSGGKAVLTTTKLPVGTNSLSATYLPATGFSESSGSASFTVQPVGHTGLGYWLVASDGGVFNYGNAGFDGSAGSLHLNKPIVGIAPTPDDGGYWLVASDGGVFNYGDAGFFGSAGAVPLNKPIVGIAATADGKGYWLVASDGGVFNYGNAGFYGSAGSFPLNKPIVGIAPTPDGKGYWLVASDGGVFDYGDAGFYGSAGSVHLNAPIVGIAATADGGGYWLVASDGGVFNYGDAAFDGSAGSIHLNKPIVAIVPSANGSGYWLIASDGGVFNYGAAGFDGSAGSLPLVKPIVGAAGS